MATPTPQRTSSGPDPSTAELYRRRWESLPEVARTPGQLLGVGAVACGATHSVLERCNLACSSCYLADDANSTEPAPFEEVAAQLVHLRAELGAGGKVQITSGEVTLLDVDELGRIVAHALELGLDPMVMTNGTRFAKDPGYLRRLVEVYGLEKVSFHVDSTMRGRPELRDGTTEAELNGLRGTYADLVRQVRRETGKPLRAALTTTVHPGNLEGVADVATFAFENADAFRIVSFLPTADVGRTEDDGGAVGLDSLWERVCRPVGRVLNPRAMQFGHPECNLTVPVLIAGRGERREIIEIVRPGDGRDSEAFELALATFARRLPTERGAVANVWAATGVLLRRPRTLAKLAGWALGRAWGHRAPLLRAVGRALTFRSAELRPLLLVVHRFMDADELATPVGRERLEACAFKLSVDGKLVSMCELNAGGGRETLTAALLKKRRQAS